MSIKTELLAVLQQKKGTYISGEALAKSLSCSRTAIWKAIRQLREEGYAIDAVTNRGYALTPENNQLSAAAICRYLDPDLSVGSILVEKEVSSTNALLKQMAFSETPPPHRTALFAESQNAGHGRFSRSFFSPPETGLYFSVLLRPKTAPKQNFFLTTCAAVAVCRAVEEVCGVSLGIKWVNDLFLNGKKVGGILTEAVSDFESGNIDFVIIGIGLNLFPPKSGFPDELKSVAGSIFPNLPDSAESASPDRNLLAARILSQLFRETENPSLSPDYIERSLVLGRTVLFRENGGTPHPVKALAILPDGSLLVEHEDGRQEALFYGEVSL